MRFLATNDDGIHAPGLALLVQAFSGLGHVSVVAPTEELSGCGHQVTSYRPLTATNVANDHHMVDGTPADCTRLGLLELAPDIDWVVSGVNRGGNLGVDVYMSGTVAAAREAALLGKPAVAFSRFRRSQEPVDWEALLPLMSKVFDVLQSLTWEPGTFWNVNFPDIDDNSKTNGPKIVICPLESAHLKFRYELEQGKYLVRGDYAGRPRNQGSDVDVCFSGNIAVTRLSVT